MNKVEISIVLVTYNPIWEKVRLTIDSITHQVDVIIQLIVADDGSSINLKERICNYLESTGNIDYLYFESRENRGTVANVLGGINFAKYEWVKIISPGDMLYDNCTLSKWVAFMNKNNATLSFGRSVLYNAGGVINTFAEYPINTHLFLPNIYRKHDAFLDNVFLKDTPNGAGYLCKRDVYIRYLTMINKRIKYAEDMIFRIMLADGYEMLYYYQYVIWYEYGVGISTSGSNKWKRIIDDERTICNEIICEHSRISLNEKVAMRYMSKLDLIKYLLIPKLILIKIQKIKSGNRKEIFAIDILNRLQSIMEGRN